VDYGSAPGSSAREHACRPSFIAAWRRQCSSGTCRLAIGHGGTGSASALAWSSGGSVVVPGAPRPAPDEPGAASREAATAMTSALLSPARPATPWRRWVHATTLGELAGFAVPTAVWGAAAAAGLGDRATALPVILAGAGEGAVLGFAQSRALRIELPAVRPRAWIGATAGAAALAWAIGMAPSTFHEALSSWPTPVLIALGAVGGVTLLVSIGVAQALVLRHHVLHAERWVAANAAGWLLGLPIVFTALALAPEDPPAFRAAVAIASGAAMGFTVAAVTGRALVGLLLEPRRHAAQPLRRRLRVRINHAHGWLYARTGGRVGGSFSGHPVLLLTTHGHRTGRPRTTPVQYERIDAALIVVAANGGAPSPPAWWRNLRDDPQASVRLGADAIRVTTTELEGLERDAVWRRLCARNRHLAGLERRARRRFPVVRLDPVHHE
jgi:deazaflavin-dependent oxidoreductase (nitroreductase family)